MVRCGWTCCDAWSGQLIHKRVVARGRSQHEGRGGSSPLYPGTLLEAKGKKEEERGERRKKKREEEEGAPLVLGLAPPLLPMQHHLNMLLSMPSATHFALHELLGALTMTDR